jgi:hypothetical protein
MELDENIPPVTRDDIIKQYNQVQKLVVQQLKQQSLLCPQCNLYHSRWQSNGAGGAGTGLKQYQITCGTCKKKPVLRNVIEHTLASSFASVDKPLLTKLLEEIRTTARASSTHQLLQAPA